MGTNRYTGQLKGPFGKNEELFDRVKKQAEPLENGQASWHIYHLGIQATPGTRVAIGGMNGGEFESKEIEIGRTRIYEAGSNETKITSIKFLELADADTIIDYQIR